LNAVVRAQAKAGERHSQSGRGKHRGIPFIDVTPDIPKKPRRNEVIVIDDEDDDDLPLFQRSALTGLTEEIVNGIVRYLEGKTDEDMRCGRIARIIQHVHASWKLHEG
jgi:hypothetical protein